jgi:isocitrate dehydrogenase
MLKVVDAAVAKAMASAQDPVDGNLRRRKIDQVYGPDVWLPEETLAAVKDYVVSIKGPLTTPVGGGIRSLNVALRQQLDLYVCLRPVRYFTGVPSPLKEPEKTNMVIFRENSEDIYAGIEYEAGSDGAKKLIDFLLKEMGVKKIRFPETSGIGIKPVSVEGTERLVRKAIQYAIDNDKPSVTIVHKGNIMKYTEGGFRDWAYALAQGIRRRADRRRPVVQVQEPEDRPRHRHQGFDRRRLPAADPAASGRIQRDRHAEPERRLHLRRAGGAGGRHRHRAGRQPVGLGGHVRSHPRHRAEVRRQGLREPGLEILSAEMMLRHMGWTEAADLIIKSMEKAIASKKVTYDFARLMEGATQVSCSGFGEVMIEQMQ